MKLTTRRLGHLILIGLVKAVPIKKRIVTGCTCGPSNTILMVRTRRWNLAEKITSNPNLIGQSSVEWKKYYYITDNLGSVRLVLEKSANESGFTLTKSYKYKPFGEIQHNFSIGPIKDNFDVTSDRQMWISKETDKESDLGDHGWRKYDNELGRFLSPDPLWEKYASLSPYQYSYNNPVDMIDENGLEAWKVNNKWDDNAIKDFASYIKVSTKHYTTKGGGI